MKSNLITLQETISEACNVVCGWHRVIQLLLEPVLCGLLYFTKLKCVSICGSG